MASLSFSCSILPWSSFMYRVPNINVVLFCHVKISIRRFVWFVKSINAIVGIFNSFLNWLNKCSNEVNMLFKWWRHLISSLVVVYSNVSFKWIEFEYLIYIFSRSLRGLQTWLWIGHISSTKNVLILKVSDIVDSRHLIETTNHTNLIQMANIQFAYTSKKKK